MSGGVQSRVVVVVLLAFVMAGCGSDRAILYKGIAGNFGKTRIRISDSQARNEGKALLAEWKQDVSRRSRAAPSERFRNLPPSLFRQRVQAAGRHYGFTIEVVQFLEPRQFAPRVVVETHRYLAIARAIPKIEQSLDPHTGADDRIGWAYEGFYLEARDERGIPFVIVSNALRGPSAGGGQWARSEELFPFAHG